MILYVLIVLILASFVFTFLGAKTWHWGYVLLVEAIFLATVGFFVLAAETLRINAVLRSQINKDEKALAIAEANLDALKNGTKDGAIIGRLRSLDPPVKIAEDAESIPSIATLDHEILVETRRRGRVWRHVMPAGIDQKTGAISVKFVAPPPPATPPAEGAETGAPPAAAPAPAAPAPAAVATSPPGLKANTVVFLFEDVPPQPAAPNGVPRSPQYLGEFTVAQAAGQQASLVPVQPWAPADFEYKRVATSRGPWIMYETMPMDNYETFAGLKEEQLKALLPKRSVAEYLRQGQAATDADDAFRKVALDADGKPVPPDKKEGIAKVVFQRRLRDYAMEFDEHFRRHVNTAAEIDAVKKDIAQLTAAEESGKKLQAYRTEERQKLTADLAGITKERQAIEQHLAQVNQLLAKARQLTADLMAKNRALTEELKAQQVGVIINPTGSNVPAKRSEPLALGRAK